MLTTTSKQKLIRQVASDLDRQEGFREFAYPDPLSALARTQKNKDWGFKPAREVALSGTDWDSGKPWTYGYGFTDGGNPDSRITKIQAERKLEQEILELDSQLSSILSWYDAASFVTKTILINMAFNMGIKSLLNFKNTLAYVKAGNFSQAATNMAKSLWYQQTGTRAKELTERMRTQTIPATYIAKDI